MLKKKKLVDLETDEDFEKFNPTWIDIHKLYDEISKEKINFNDAIKRMFKLAYIILKDAEDDGTFEDIIDYFESMKNSLEVHYFKEFSNLREIRFNEYNIIKYFNNLIFERDDYLVPINQLKKKLKIYNEK
jgi:D-serine dehydratase